MVCSLDVPEVCVLEPSSMVPSNPQRVSSCKEHPDEAQVECFVPCPKIPQAKTAFVFREADYGPGYFGSTLFLNIIIPKEPVAHLLYCLQAALGQYERGEPKVHCAVDN